MTNKEAKEMLESFLAWDIWNDDEAMALTLAIDALAIDTLTEKSKATNENIKFALSQLGAYFAIKIRDGKEGNIAKELYARVEELKKLIPFLYPEQKTEDDEEGLSELKPCPFCGSEAKIMATSVGVCVKCLNCSCQTEFDLDHTIADARKKSAVEKSIEAWNRRVNDE